VKLTVNKNIKKIKPETLEYKKKQILFNEHQRRPLSAIFFKRK
jgi:hypothetical protein